jgi:hypothetical protein
MRKILLIVVVFGLLINSALANNSQEEQAIINVFQLLTTEGEQVKSFSKVTLNALNLILKHHEAKFTVEQAIKYQDQKLTGRRYLVKNVSKEPIYLSEQFGGKEDELLALICSNNILAPNKKAIVYLVERLV